jgi:uncharacterized protein (DUF4415 family)
MRAAWHNFLLRAMLESLSTMRTGRGWQTRMNAVLRAYVKAQNSR